MARQPEPPKHVLFAMSDTGGGHRAAALAIGDALDSLYGSQVSWEQVDVFSAYGPWPLNRLPRLYYPLVTRWVWLWQLVWKLGAMPAVWQLTGDLMLAWNRRRLHRLFADQRADLVVSVHPLLNHVLRRALRRYSPATPFATVVTDLVVAHPVWLDPEVNLLCVPSGAVKTSALAAGVSEEHIFETGIPISMDFANSQGQRSACLKQLGLLDLPTVLLLGGGEGMGPLESVAAALAETLTDFPAQLVIICGRNRSLQDRLLARQWPMPVRIEGFVSNMAQWMGAADCLVTKAGPGTIAEALASGLPMVLSAFVPGQEEGNVVYVVENGVGAYCPEPTQIAALVARWLQPGNEDLTTKRRRARDLARPRAAQDIAHALYDLMD